MHTLASRYLCTACLILIIAMGSSSNEVIAGPYKDSAHGDTTVGVIRSDITAAGYSRGNCAHCHEKHASIEGDEPAPVDGSPSAFLLFTDNFDTSVTGYPYSESDNICFSCHNDAGSIMQVNNNNYAETFADFTPTTPINGILDSFTPLGSTHTEHNLKDVYNYAKDNFSYFTDSSNPCAACHNPHLAKRNKTDPDNPALTAISRPTDHDNLWGDSAGETMADSVGANTYLPPYYWNSTTTYEPAGSALHDGSKLPDYNTFCLDCHANADVYSTTFGRNLTAIDWGATGDIHGDAPRIAGQYFASATLSPPYDTTAGATTPNYVLSCLDCHKPHGSVFEIKVDIPMPALLRKTNNGKKSAFLCCGEEEEYIFTALGYCRNCHSQQTKHCGSTEACFTCHYHGASNIASGCGPAWNNKAF